MNKVRDILKFLCISVLGVFLIIILSGSLVYKADFDIVRYGDTSVLKQQNVPQFIIGVGDGMAIFTILWLIVGKGRKFDLLKYGWLLLFINVVLQILVIFFFRIKLTADWEVLYNIAKEFTKNNFSALQSGGYLYAYPHNLGITLYFTILNIIAPGNIYLLRVLNIVYSLITIIIINKTFLTLNPENQKYSREFFIISVFFIPAVFMSNLAYNEVVSTMLFLTAVYLCIKFINNQNTKLLISSAFLFSIAHFIRSIGFLFVGAVFFYFLLVGIKLRKIALFIILVTIGFTSPLWLINRVFMATGKISEAVGINSIPITKWVHMGLTKKYFGYWDQGESYWMYARDATWDKKEASRLYREGIKRKIIDYGWPQIVNIYYKKVVWLWTEGTYQSVYLGMSHSNPGGYLEKTRVSDFFEQHLERRDIFKLPMYFGNIVSLLTILIFTTYVTWKRKLSLITRELILVLLLLAFISFYLIWEVKPRYIYPVYPYLLLLFFISFIKLLKVKRQFGSKVNN